MSSNFNFSDDEYEKVKGKYPSSYSRRMVEFREYLKRKNRQSLDDFWEEYEHISAMEEQDFRADWAAIDEASKPKEPVRKRKKEE